MQLYIYKYIHVYIYIYIYISLRRVGPASKDATYECVKSDTCNRMRIFDRFLAQQSLVNYLHTHIHTCIHTISISIISESISISGKPV